MTINQLRNGIPQQGILLARMAVFLCALAFVDSTNAQQDPDEVSSSVKAALERIERLTGPGPTHHLIEVGEHVLKAPVEYVNQISVGSDLFTMLIYWPGMVPYQKRLSENFKDLIKISVSEGAVEEIEKVAKSRKKYLESTGEVPITEDDAPKLKVYSLHDGFRRYYFAEDTAALVGQDIIMISCGPAFAAFHEVGTCSTRFSPISGVTVMMRFDRKTLPHWQYILSHIFQLVKNFKDEKDDL